jgi:hypothetical protein
MTREQIKSLRKLQKLSQAELGRLTNLTASEISRIECGYRSLTDEESAAIASVLQSKQPPPPPPPRGMVKAAKTAGATATVSAAPTAAVVEAQPPTSPAQPPVIVEAAPPKPLPAGNDLSDPANFGVLPDLGLLNPGTLDREAFRARLSTAIARANTILHTPRVPAAVWRAWRQFEQQATALLRETVAEAPTPAPSPIPVPVKAPPMQAPTPEAAAEKGESKSFNSLFVEAARSVLPPPLVEHLNQAAEAARTADASIGFMKHFRQIAERELDPALLKSVTDEAGTRAASPERSRVRRGRGR